MHAALMRLYHHQLDVVARDTHSLRASYRQCLGKKHRGIRRLRVATGCAPPRRVASGAPVPPTENSPTGRRPRRRRTRGHSTAVAEPQQGDKLLVEKYHNHRRTGSRRSKRGTPSTQRPVLEQQVSPSGLVAVSCSRSRRRASQTHFGERGIFPLAQPIEVRRRRKKRRRGRVQK